MNLGGVFKNLKDYIFPINCLGCNKEGVWLCDSCFSKLKIIDLAACPICHKENIDGTCCDNCQEKSFLQSERAVFVYREGDTVSKIIHALKYNYIEDLLSPIESILDLYFANNNFGFEIDFVVPIPLHKKRLAERGFNQAEFLAKIVGNNLGRPVLGALKRQKETQIQAKLDKENRAKNVKEAFAIEEGVNLEGKRILLVDDVYTTGSTMQEAARVLTLGGVEVVHGFTLARG